MKKTLSTLAAATILLAGACGGSSAKSSSVTTVKGVTTTTAAVTTAAPVTTAAVTTAAPTTTAASATTKPAAAAGAVDVTLKEWSVESNKALPVGKTTFNIKNAGQFGHEFLVIKGVFAELPKTDIGAVDEAKLAAGALIGNTKVATGASGTATYDLAAGSYVFICNIVNGPTSHAVKGQVLDVKVA